MDRIRSSPTLISACRLSSNLRQRVNGFSSRADTWGIDRNQPEQPIGQTIRLLPLCRGIFEELERVREERYQSRFGYTHHRCSSFGSPSSHPSFITPHRPIIIASAASCLSEVGRGASDHSMMRRAISPACFFDSTPVRCSRE